MTEPKGMGEGIICVGLLLALLQSLLNLLGFSFNLIVASGLLSWGHLISSDCHQLDFTDTI